jgi:hypothetical protein
VPGGAVVVDKQGQGFITDVVAGDLYGNLWQLDATTGLSRYPTKKPVFSFSGDFHPIGSMPAIYSNGSTQFAVVVSGGYDDPTDTGSGSASTLWSQYATTPQEVVAVSLSIPTTATLPILDTSTNTTYVPFKFPLNSGDLGYSQATIVGGQLFVTADSTDVNASGYGTTGASTGHVYSTPLSSTATVIATTAGGASGLASNGTGASGMLYAASANQQTTIASAMNGSSGTGVDTFTTSHLLRMLWLRTE